MTINSVLRPSSSIFFSPFTRNGSNIMRGIYAEKYQYASEEAGKAERMIAFVLMSPFSPKALTTKDIMKE